MKYDTIKLIYNYSNIIFNRYYMSFQSKYLDDKLRISAGPAAAHINDDANTQITVDWSFDGLYYKYKDHSWITLSLGPQTEKNEIDKINTPEMKSNFKSLCFFALEQLKGYSGHSDKALVKLQEIVDLFV